MNARLCAGFLYFPFYHAYRMPTDPGDVDFYSPEEKQRHHEEWLRSEHGQRLQKEMDRSDLAATIGRTATWVAIGVIVLVVGAAILKWAMEELLK